MLNCLKLPERVEIPGEAILGSLGSRASYYERENVPPFVWGTESGGFLI